MDTLGLDLNSYFTPAEMKEGQFLFDTVRFAHGYSFYDTWRKLVFLLTLNNEYEVQLYAWRFAKLTPYEALLRKDMKDFTTSEWASVFNEQKWLLYHSFCNRKIEFATYVSWCNKQPVANTAVGQLQHSDVNSNIKMATSFYASITDLVECMESVLSRAGLQQALIARDIAFYSLVWYGLKPDEIVELRSQDIDFDACTVFVSHLGQKITIDPKIMRYCKLAMCALYISKREIGDAITTYDLDQVKQVNDYLIKTYAFNEESEQGGALGTSIKPMNRLNFVREFSRKWSLGLQNLSPLSPYYGKKVTTKNVRINGQFFKFFQIEQSGNVLTPHNYEQIAESSHPTTITNLMIVYGQWKKFFYQKED